MISIPEQRVIPDAESIDGYGKRMDMPLPSRLGSARRAPAGFEADFGKKNCWIRKRFWWQQFC